MWTRLAWPSDPSVLRRNHAIILGGGLRPPSSFEGGLRPPFPSEGGAAPPPPPPPPSFAAQARPCEKGIKPFPFRGSSGRGNMPPHAFPGGGSPRASTTR